MTGFQLKTIATLAMFVDHITESFITPNTLASQLMYGIGRLTFPIMAYFISEGFNRTSNLESYIKRMGIFALISHIPFRYFVYGREGIIGVSTSIIYTFLISLLVLYVLEENSIKLNLKIILITILMILSLLGDYSIFGPLLELAFHKGYGDINTQIRNGSYVILGLIVYAISLTGSESLYMIATLIPLLLLSKYNGKRGYSNKYSKYIFYIIYPLHFIILGILQNLTT